MNKINRWVLLITELTVLLILLYVFIRLEYKYNYIVKLNYLPNVQDILEAHYKALLLIVIFWLIIAKNIGLYYQKRFNYLREILKKVFYQIFSFAIILFTISGIKEDPLISPEYVIQLTIVLLVFMLMIRIVTFVIEKRSFVSGKNIQNVIIFGTNSNTEKFIETLQSRKDFGYKIIKHLKSGVVNEHEAQQFLAKHQIKRVFLAQSGFSNSQIEWELQNFCEDNHIQISYIPYTLSSSLLRLDIEYLDTIPVFNIKKYPLDVESNQLIKVLFDFLFSLIVCVLILSWLYPIIALLIKLDSKGPVIFKQKRRGLNGNEFDCYKFRTMRNDGTNSIKATVVNDYRITKIGNFLRKTSIDELPQFLNVLKGDMSIVGPRPHMISQDKHYSEIIKKYNLRNYVKPGITGLAQVKGYRGAIDSDKDMEDRIRTDIFYVRNWFLLLDIQIIYQTVVLVFKGDENAI